jgi:hypothetical protein
MAEKKKQSLPPNVITPLQGYAHQAHEFYTALQDAGFTIEEAWSLLLRTLPDWEIEEPDLIGEDEIDLEDWGLDEEE